MYDGKKQANDMFQEEKGGHGMVPTDILVNAIQIVMVLSRYFPQEIIALCVI